MMTRARIVPLIWTALGIYLGVEGYRLELGTLRDPGPGFFIFGMALVLALLSVITYLRASRSAVAANEDPAAIDAGGTRHWRKVAGFVAALLVYSVVFRPLGFIVSTFLLLFFLFRVVGARSWQKALLFSVISAVVGYLVFGVSLGGQLPAGVLARLFN